MYLHKAFIGVLASSCAFSGVNASIRHAGKHEERAMPGGPPAAPPSKADKKSLDYVDMGPSCTNSNTWCTYWANHGECVINPGYMLTSCCSSCSAFTCHDDTGRDQPEFFPVCAGLMDGDYCDGTSDCSNNPTWCECGVGQSFCQSDVNPCPPTVGYYDDFVWEEMPDRIKDAWYQLGWSEQLWDSGGTSISVNWAWDDLGHVAQNAAIVLGYNEWSWDATSSLREIA